MSHGPIVREQNAMMNDIARSLDTILNGGKKPTDRKIGFALLTYYMGEDLKGTDRINYIGNGNRADMLIALKELVARWEGRVPEEPTVRQ